MPPRRRIRSSPRTFAEGCNADLADGLGNLAGRVLTFAATRFDGHVPAPGEPGEAEERLASRRTPSSAPAPNTSRRSGCGAPAKACGRSGRSAIATSRRKRRGGRSAAALTGPLVQRGPRSTCYGCRRDASPVLPDIAAYRGALGDVHGAFGRQLADAWLREPGGQPVSPPGALFPRLRPDWAAGIASRYGL